jgi:alkanesulfonate monooxygenase SsuD/methylene tetrahydromethanopterin reductase-like flavin-dependent oxidoreductase (luciferase family)
MTHAHFTVFVTGVGYHEAAWRVAEPGDLGQDAWFGVLERAARTAERGLLDAVFLADSPGLETWRAGSPPSTTCPGAGPAGTS